MSGITFTGNRQARKEWLARIVAARVNPEKFKLGELWLDAPLSPGLLRVAMAVFTGARAEIPFLKDLYPGTDYEDAWRRVVLWALPRIREHYPIEDPKADPPLSLNPGVEDFFKARAYRSPARRESAKHLNTWCVADISYLGKVRKYRVGLREEIWAACREAASEDRDRLGREAAAVERDRPTV